MLEFTLYPIHWDGHWGGVKCITNVVGVCTYVCVLSWKFWSGEKLVLGTNIPGKMAWADYFSLKILVKGWNIGPSCKNGLCSDRSWVVVSFKRSSVERYYGISSAELEDCLSSFACGRVACLVGTARLDLDHEDRVRGANRKTLQNYVQCVGSDGVICEL